MRAIDHVQLAMPPGQEDSARAFYGGVLGLPEVPKPPNLAGRGGVWFSHAQVRVHLGVEAEFRPARKAHPAFLVQHLGSLIRRCEEAGYSVVSDEPLEGYRRAYVSDPFGNRIELIETVAETNGPLSNSLVSLLKKRLDESVGGYRIPPPVFTYMDGGFVAFDEENGALTVRFPLREHYLNPYDAVQGGMIAAAVDNTLGPLSMLVAPPNVTRRLEMIYSRPATLDMEHIIVVGRLVERKGRQLHFVADVSSPQRVRLARARATHWIVGAMES